MAALGRVADFGQALGAHGQIGGDSRLRSGLAKTRADFERRRAIFFTRHFANFDLVDACLRRVAALQDYYELVQGGLFALHFHAHQVGLV